MLRRNLFKLIATAFVPVPAIVKDSTRWYRVTDPGSATRPWVVEVIRDPEEFMKNRTLKVTVKFQPIAWSTRSG